MEINSNNPEINIAIHSNNINLESDNTNTHIESNENNIGINSENPNIGIQLPKEIGTGNGKVQDVYVNGESVLDKNGIAQINNVVQDENYVHTDNNFTDVEKQKLAELENYDDTEIKKELEDKADKNWVKEFYYSDDIYKYTWYSYTGVKTLNNIKVPISGTRTTNIIEGIYRLLDYGLDGLIEDYSYLGYALHNIQIPKEDYIDDVESKKITIDLFNRGKAIIETRPFDDIYTCAKITLINYLQGWSVKFDENKNELEVLYDTDTSEFIKNTVDNLVNYYKKSETYSKEEIDALFKAIEQLGYATEQWVKDQNYMPIQDFQDYVKYFYYTKDEVNSKVKEVDDKITNLSENVYSKEEIDNKLENLPTGGTNLTEGDNIVIEDNAINVYTNTGYKVIDKDIKLQSIIASGTTGTNKMVYVDGKEIEIIYDGTNYIRRSENGIDFEVIELPCACKDLVYNADAERLYGTNGSNYFIYSEDDGLTWNTILSNYAKGTDYLSIGFGTGFKGIVKSTRKVNSYTFNKNGTVSLNSTITSAITPEFLAMVNSTQFVWCNSTGNFKYGAGSNEGDFASLSGVTVNMLKRINDITFLGLKNSNKFYILEPATSIRDYKWIPYTLPNTCTVNDIIYNPYEEIYYILNNINTYYKTKDFVNYESVDTGLKATQGHFTLMGIQGVTTNHNELFLAPTRTTLEDKLQEHDRDLNKSLWVGKGLELTAEGKVNAKSASESIGINDNGIFLIQVKEYQLTDEIVEAIYVSVAEIDDNFDPYNMDSWFWEFGYPSEKNYKATKLVFNQDGSFWDQNTWETEYIVEKNEYGYIFADNSGSIFKYVKLGKFTRPLGGE